MTKKFTTDTTAAAELFGTASPAPAKTAKVAQVVDTPADAIPAAQPIEIPTPPPITQTPAQVVEGSPICSWKARPDGERRSRRLQITAKPSIAAKAATIAREKGYSVNYLFELLIASEWNKTHGGK